MLLHLPKKLSLTNDFKRLSIFVILVLVNLISKAQSGTFTINQNADASATNFQSFSEASEFISAGITGPVVFNVVTGTGPYFDQVAILPVPGTSATNTVTFNGNGETLEFTSTNSNMRAGVKLDGAHHIIFDGLKVKSHTTNTEFSYGWGFSLLRDADSNIIRNCTVNVENNTLWPQNTYGIMIGSTDDYPATNGLSYCDANIITGNTVVGGSIGINVDNYAGNMGADVTPINGNQITNNTVKNFISTGILLLWTNNTLVEGNDIAVAIDGGAGIQANEFSSRLMIRNNRIHNFTDSVLVSNARQAIKFSYCNPVAGSENTVANNLVYNFNTPGSQEGIAIDGSSYVNVYHNTVAMDGQTDNGDFVYGINFSNTNTNVNSINNIVVVTSLSTGNKFALVMDAASITTVSNNNDLYNVTGSAGTYNGKTFASLSDWQIGAGKDLHSVSVNPVFIDPATGNYKPSANIIDNLGMYVNVDADITGAARNNTNPDMGAYEFLSTPCSTPAVAGTGKVLPGGIMCAGTLITVTTTGNSAGLGQTYQWQTATTPTGVYTDLGAPMITPYFDGVANNTLYYRLQVSCASAVSYTVPLLIKVNTGLPADVYTINKLLPTADNNFTSFADVINNFKCGINGPIVLNVVPGSGPYNEQVIIPAITGSSAINTVTINGNGETLSYLATSSSQRATLKLNGASNIIIDSMNITALGSDPDEAYGFGVQLLNNSDNNIIRRCHINVTPLTSEENFAGIVISAKANSATGTGTTSLCDSNQIIGNTITGGFYGITLAGNTSAGTIINNNNKILNNKVLDFLNAGVYISGTNNTLVEGNDFSRPARTNGSGQFDKIYGVYVTSLSTGLKVSKNRVHDLYGSMPASLGTAYGIYTSGSNGTAAIPNIYSNNVVYNINGTTGIQYGLYISGSQYAHYYNNTISLEDPLNAAGTTNTYGFYQTGTSTGLDFRNNVVTIKRGGAGIKYGIYINGSASLAYTADNNDYFINSATGVNNIGFYNTNSYATLSDWQSGSGKDAASFALDPLYTNAATGDLSINASALDNKGAPVGIATDINGNVRSTTTPDMGAYENSQVLPVKIVGVTAIKVANNVVVTWATASEFNSRSFIVERSIDGVSFTAAGTVNAMGNSNTLHQYSFTDVGAAGIAANILYYRVKSVDIDSKFDYTKIVSVNLSSSTVVAVTVFPNPYVNQLYAKVIAGGNGKATIELKDAVGRIITRQVQQVTEGINIINIDRVSQLPGGVYFVSVEVNGVRYLSRVKK